MTVRRARMANLQHNPQKAGQSACPEGELQKFGENSTSRRHASVLMSAHVESAAVETRKTELYA